MKVDGSFKAQVMADTENCFCSRKQAIGSRETMGASNLHHARSFIIFKKQRSFNTSGGYDHAFCTDFDISFIVMIVFTSDLKGGN